MALVFRADGLDGGEKLLLLAYANHTDAHGYCWPSEQRLADCCGTSLSTVARQKRSLTAKGLLKSVRRINPRTGEPITNLTRLNVTLLESMRRPERSYDDDMVQQITFEGDQPGSDLLKCHSDRYPLSDRQVPPVNMAGTPCQSDRQNLIEPSVETSPPPPRAPLELVPPQAEDRGGGGDAPQQQEEQNNAAAAFVDRLPYRGRIPGPRQRTHLIERVGAALTAGWTEWALRVQLTEETDSAKSLAAVYRHRLDPENLPAAPPLPRPRTGGEEPARPQREKCSGCGCPIRKQEDVSDSLCKTCREDQAPKRPRRVVVDHDTARKASAVRSGIVKG
jgi:hypothetical protein